MEGFKLFFLKNKWNALVAMSLSLMEATLLFIASRKIKVFFDRAVANHDLRLVQEALLTFALLYLTRFILGLLNSYFINRIHYTGLLSFREEIFDRLFKTRFDYFINNSSARLWTEVNQVTNKLGLFYNAMIRIGVAFFQICIYGYIIFKVSPLAGGITMAAFPLISLMTFFVRKKFAYYEQQSVGYFRKVGGNAVEAFDLVKIMKAKNEYHYFKERFRKEHQRLNKQVVTLGVYQSYLDHFIVAVTAIFPMVIIYIAMRTGRYIHLTMGEIFVIYSMIPLFLNTSTSIYTYVVRFFGIKPYLKQLHEYLSLPEESAGQVRELVNYEIQLTDLSYDFGSRQVQLPDLKIREGEWILLQGESGIGKSTLFHVLTGLSPDYEGEVLIGGVNLKEIDLSALRQWVGISFQENKIFEGTLKENVLLSLRVNEQGWQEIIQKTMLEDLAHALSDQPISNDRLSGGEKARIQLAQTLLRNPKILLIDESLSAVDEGMEQSILKKIRTHYPKATVVMISHRGSSQQYFDRVIQLKKESEELEVGLIRAVGSV